jgi:3-oxoacid CoA-transferase subunit B
MMTHTARDGAAKIVAERTYPLTAMKVVTKIFTDMAVISVTPNGFVLDEVAPGLTADDVQAVTDAPLNMDAVGTIDVAA